MKHYFCLKCHNTFNETEACRLSEGYSFVDVCPRCKAFRIIGKNEISPELIDYIDSNNARVAELEAENEFCEQIATAIQDAENLTPEQRAKYLASGPESIPAILHADLAEANARVAELEGKLQAAEMQIQSMNAVDPLGDALNSGDGSYKP